MSTETERNRAGPSETNIIPTEAQKHTQDQANTTSLFFIGFSPSLIGIEPFQETGFNFIKSSHYSLFHKVHVTLRIF